MRFLFIFLLAVLSLPAFAAGSLVVGMHPTTTPQVIGVVNQRFSSGAGGQALQLCKERGLLNCTVLLNFENACAVTIYGQDTKRMYHALGSSADEALNNARSICNAARGGGCYSTSQTTTTCDRTPVAASSTQPSAITTSTRAAYNPETWSPFDDPGVVIILSLIGIGFAIFVLIKFINAGERRKQEAALQAERERIAAERLTQLNALRAAMPKSPVKSMRATIQTNTYKGEAGVFHFTVDMMLELTETERAIIKEHELDDIVLEDIPLFDKEALERKEHQIEEHREAFDRATRSSKMLDAKLSEQVDVAVLAAMKKARLITTVGQLVVIPFSRAFDSPHEANEYASLLKTKLLPEMKRLIQKHGQHRQTETVEF